MKVFVKFIFAVVLASILTGCSINNEKSIPVNDNNDYLLLSTLFQQYAAEKRALSYQAFNIARIMLDNELKQSRLTKKLAIVVDVDETVLDNSPFEAKSILENSNYPTYWNEWCEQAKARSIAGSVEFLQYAASKGVAVFYITNRKIALMDATVKNLRINGFPFAEKDYVLMRTDDSNKESRRNVVEVNHHIIILMGDNLGDFMHIFDDKTIAERFALTDSIKDEFGRRFIVLPNPMYGSWASEMLKNTSISNEQKAKLLKDHLISF